MVHVITGPIALRNVSGYRIYSIDSMPIATSCVMATRLPNLLHRLYDINQQWNIIHGVICTLVHNYEGYKIILCVLAKDYDVYNYKYII